MESELFGFTPGLGGAGGVVVVTAVGTYVPSFSTTYFLVVLWFGHSHDNSSPLLKSHNGAGPLRLKAQTQERL